MILLEDLRVFYEKKKKAKSAEFQKIIYEQKAYLQRFEKEIGSEKLFITELIAKLKRLELYKEFNLPLPEFERLLKEKYIEENVSLLFTQEIAEINKLIQQLKELFEQQYPIPSDLSILLNKEEIFYIELERLFIAIQIDKEKIKHYFNDINSLTYKKAYIKTGQIIAKLIKGTLLRIQIEGIEYIPKKGPCILAPHHYHAALDPLILYACIDRPLFFLTSVETFIAVPIAEPFLYKLGLLPLKRDERLFSERLAHAVPYKKVNAYPSSNLETLKKSLTHLKCGDALVVFPEGEAKIIATFQRAKDQDFLEPQSGFIALAMLAKRKYNIDVPIIPIGFKYSGGIFQPIYVRIGLPMILPDLKEASQNAIKKFISEYTNTLFEQIKVLSQ